MKKSLIALAVLAAAGAASAQSSVTVYGRVVAAVMKTPGTSARIDTTNGTSQLGFRGVEDLGGGLKATFDLRHRFATESGMNDGSSNGRPFWQGSSKVGLAGGFGSVEIGRMLTALQGPVNLSDPWGTETVGSTAVLASGYATDPRATSGTALDGAGLGRTDVITYNSPNLGGFSGSFSVGPKRSAAAGGAAISTGAENLYSLWLQFANGPIYVGGGYEQNRFDDNLTAILGSFDFGVAKVMGGYSQVDTVAIAGEKRKNWNLGVAAPLGAAVLKAGFANSEAEGTGTETRTLSLGAEYNLSKRTYLFTTASRSRTAGVTGSSFDVGISHSF